MTLMPAIVWVEMAQKCCVVHCTCSVQKRSELSPKYGCSPHEGDGGNGKHYWNKIICVRNRQLTVKHSQIIILLTDALNNLASLMEE